MIRINDNFTLLSPSYLFTEVNRRVTLFKQSLTDAEARPVISMGIGDVSLPLCRAAVDGLIAGAVDESAAATFHGYGPEQGYAFLRDLIARHDYADRGIDIAPDEIFVSDGAKSDLGNIGDILSTDCRVAVTDPVYPVYVDTNVMAGRAGRLLPDGSWSGLEMLPCTKANGYLPPMPSDDVDIVYLCYPNNPTGTTLTRSQLKQWVDWALAHNALILFDSAYESYITDTDVPHSIYEIEGARRCAIEFRSFSKTAGFTGVRCGYTVVPSDLYGTDSHGEPVSLRALWNRRQSTKFNGASYVSQRAAAAVYSPQGREQVRANIDYYMANAEILRQGLSAAGLQAVGGINAPYIWVSTPGEMSSWEFFDLLLHRCRVVGTPGVGFGPSGEGCFRLTAFNTRENTERAVERIAREKF